MSEMMQVLNAKLPKNVVMKNPAGTYSFVGQVNIELKYAEYDGSPLTEETAKKIINFGAGMVHPRPKVITWKTEEEALQALAELG